MEHAGDFGNSFPKDHLCTKLPYGSSWSFIFPFANDASIFPKPCVFDLIFFDKCNLRLSYPYILSYSYSQYAHRLGLAFCDYTCHMTNKCQEAFHAAKLATDFQCCSIQWIYSLCHVFRISDSWKSMNSFLHFSIIGLVGWHQIDIN